MNCPGTGRCMSRLSCPVLDAGWDVAPPIRPQADALNGADVERCVTCSRPMSARVWGRLYVPVPQGHTAVTNSGDVTGKVTQTSVCFTAPVASRHDPRKPTSPTLRRVSLLLQQMGAWKDADWVCHEFRRQSRILTLQRDALKRTGCEKIIEDTVSGGKVQRPGLEPVHDTLRSGDVLAVWRLYRLGRSRTHLIELMGELEAERIGFQSLTESIDTTTPSGKRVFHIFGAITEFERNLIRERTYAGLAAARARGRREAAGEKSLVTSSVPWRSICTGRRNTRLTKSAKRSASQGRRSTCMSPRRLVTDDDRSRACGAASADLAGYRLGGRVLPTLRSIRPTRKAPSAVTRDESLPAR